MRCDLNVSLAPVGSGASGTRTEIKNVNSFTFAAKAIEYEIGRQRAILESGGRVAAETMRYDEATGKTVAMRQKETTADYRFFPEPDLVSLRITEARVECIRAELPTSAAERKKKYIGEYGIIETDADIILTSVAVADYFESAASVSKYPRICANLLLSELLARTDAEDFKPPLTFSELSELAALFGDGVINSSTVKRLIPLIAETGSNPRALVEELGLGQINDRDALSALLAGVFEAFPKLLADFKGGKTAAKKAIIGKAMGQSGGKANPVILNEIFEKMTK